jgi:hypothetical protein
MGEAIIVPARVGTMMDLTEIGTLRSIKHALRQGYAEISHDIPHGPAGI